MFKVYNKIKNNSTSEGNKIIVSNIIIPLSGEVVSRGEGWWFEAGRM